MSLFPFPTVYAGNAALGFCGDGDSHMYGNADPANAMPVFLQTYTPFHRSIFANLAQNGWTWQNVNNTYVTATQPYQPNITRLRSVFWLHVGSNNIQIGDTGASIYTGVAAILAAVKAMGFIVGATVPWASSTWNASQLTALGTYRTSMQSDPSITSGLLLDGNTMFPVTDVPPNFIDGNDHLAPTGQAVYAGYVNAAMMTVF